ncbi:glycosyltransferase family 4 protein [Aquirhabdus sp.]|uniref:glycosyltransferase family 4 protein n=1 Tax=Aquirhabdus sp. TaxID=2824160 RepID=UPI00396CED99
MFVLIDMQACQCGSKYRGIGRYTIAIVRAMLLQANENIKIKLLLNGMFEDSIAYVRHELYGYIDHEDILVWYGVPDEDNASGRELSIKLLQHFILRLDPDIYFIPSFFEGFRDQSITTASFPVRNKIKTVVTIHDLIPLLQKNTYLDPYPKFNKFYLNQITQVKQADFFLTTSESSKSELLELLDIDPHQVINTSEGAEAFFQPQPLNTHYEKLVLAKYNISKKFVLYTGASDERKNLLRLIEAYSQLSKSLQDEFILVFAGGMPNEHMIKFRRYAEICGLEPEQLILTGRITDREMLQLYSCCTLYCFPSWHEGFGLPVLEAMCCGAAVICANASSLPEIIDNPEQLFDPYDVMSIAHKMELALSNPELLSSFREYAAHRIQTFSWHRAADSALQRFKELIHENSKNVTLSTHALDQWIEKTIKKDMRKGVSQEVLLGKVAEALYKNYRTLSLSKGLKNGRVLIHLNDLFEENSTISYIDRFALQQFILDFVHKNDDQYHFEFTFSQESKLFKFASILDFQSCFFLNQSPKSVLNEIVSLNANDTMIFVLINGRLMGDSQFISQLKKSGVRTSALIDAIPIELEVESSQELKRTFYDIISEAVNTNNASLHYFAPWYINILSMDKIFTTTEKLRTDVTDTFAKLNVSIPQQDIPVLSIDHDMVTSDQYQPKPRFLQHLNKGMKSSANEIDILINCSAVDLQMNITIFKKFRNKILAKNKKGDFLPTIGFLVPPIHKMELLEELIRIEPLCNEAYFLLKPTDLMSMTMTIDKAYAFIDLNASSGISFLQQLAKNNHILYRNAQALDDHSIDHVFQRPNKPSMGNWSDFFAKNATNFEFKDRFKSLSNINESESFLKTSGKHLNFPLGSGQTRCKTAIGSLAEDHISTTGSKGILVYGPYTELASGSYIFKILYTSDHEQHVTFDIASDNGRKILVPARKLLLSAAQEPTMLSIYTVFLKNRTSHLEFRTMVDETNHLKIYAVTIAFVSDDSIDLEKEIIIA